MQNLVKKLKIKPNKNINHTQILEPSQFLSHFQVSILQPSQVSVVYDEANERQLGKFILIGQLTNKIELITKTNIINN